MQDEILQFLENNDLYSESLYLSQCKLKKDLRTLFEECGFIELNKNVIEFTSFGYWFFNKSNSQILYYIDDDGGFNPQDLSPFMSIAKLFEYFEEAIPKYEERGNLIRRDVPEVSSDLFKSIIVFAINQSDLFEHKILIEQLDDAQILKIRGFNGKNDNQKEMDSVVLFLSKISLIPSNFYRVLRNAILFGLIDFDLNRSGFEYSINYFSSSERQSVGGIKTLNLYERAVLKYINRFERIKRGNIIYDLRINERSVARILNKLVDLGYVERVGEKGHKDTYYIPRDGELKLEDKKMSFRKIMDWKHSTRESFSSLPESDAVYLIVAKTTNDEYVVIYTGQTNNIKRRTAEHWGEGEQNLKLKNIIERYGSSISLFYALDHGNALDGHERYLFDFYNPQAQTNAPDVHSQAITLPPIAKKGRINEKYFK